MQRLTHGEPVQSPRTSLVQDVLRHHMHLSGPYRLVNCQNPGDLYMMVQTLTGYLSTSASSSNSLSTVRYRPARWSDQYPIDIVGDTLL